MEWNLDDLYKGFNDSKFTNDIERLKELVVSYNLLPDTAKKVDELTLIKEYINISENITILVRNLSSFCSLINSTDVTNQESLANMSLIRNILNDMTSTDVFITRYLKNVDLDKYKDDEVINSNYFYLNKNKVSAKYLLSEEEEILYSKLSQLSSSSWGQVQSLLTSNLDVDYNGSNITLPEVRNLAYDSSKEVRKDAYYAELESYKKIEDIVAMSLSNIKREVTVMNDLRGFNNPLEPTLIRSNMKKETLDAMIDAMKDFRNDFERYFIAKSKYLGHDKALPFYDLFAPVGSLNTTYTYEEAQDIVNDSFASFSSKLANFSKKAFDLNWVDPFPKKGKRGGAFCSNQPQIKQSRILSNFTGSLSDVSTLAHELGHGYHGEIIGNNSPLNWSYPMPLAETASIFCETIVTKHLLTKIDKPEERLSILEVSLQGDAQVIIDILSRFIFEESIFELSNGPISKDKMKELMIKAQKEAYQGGLDHDLLHPYMWLNKGHYYSAGLNFYNFPYAFGLLFGKGLYAQYLKNNDEFIKKYDDLLALTTKASVEYVAASMGIDVTNKQFWVDSLNIIKEDIEEVIKLMS